MTRISDRSASLADRLFGEHSGSWPTSYAPVQRKRRAIMIEVVQAFDRTSIARLDSDDAAALDRKIEAARRLFADRGAWLKPHHRIEILRNTTALMEGMRDHLGRQIAREGGQAIDGCADRNRPRHRRGAQCSRRAARLGGREIPMGLTPASVDRRAFTIVEPIGIVAAISAFNLPSMRPTPIGRP